MSSISKYRDSFESLLFFNSWGITLSANFRLQRLNNSADSLQSSNVSDSQTASYDVEGSILSNNLNVWYISMLIVLGSTLSGDMKIFSKL